MNILTNLVRNYQRDQFNNYGKVLNYPMAQQELLHDGTIWFFLPGTTNLTNAWVGDNQIQISANPANADEHGEFPPMYLNGSYKIEVRNSKGVPLLSIDNLNICEWLS